MNKELLKNVGIGLAIVLALFGVTRPAVKETVIEKVPYGAATSPDISSPYFSFGGVRHWATHQNVAQATSTFCAMQSPPATTTLLFASVNLTTSSSSAQTVVIAKAATQFATTTLLGQLASAANATPVVIATSTTALTDGIVAPNSWITAGWSGALGGGVGSAPVGVCNAVFVEVN